MLLVKDSVRDVGQFAAFAQRLGVTVPAASLRPAAPLATRRAGVA